MRIGVDSYSYHRLLGEIRPGEEDPGVRFENGTWDVIAECRRLGVDGMSLETCFMDPPGVLDTARLRAEAGAMEVVFAWGHPHGLEFGANPAATDDLIHWIELAPAVGCTLVRLVCASPRFRGAAPIDEQIAATVPELRRAAAAARAVGVDLAVENHADLTAAEMLRLLDAVGEDNVGVCLDTANALRVGDDPAEAARLLAPRTRMVHLKDCAPDWTDPVTGPVSVAYGTGVIELRKVLKSLRDLSGLACIELAQFGGEAEEKALIRASVRWLRANLRPQQRPRDGGQRDH